MMHSGMRSMKIIFSRLVQYRHCLGAQSSPHDMPVQAQRGDGSIASTNSQPRH
jgi:hypothetical protein